MCKITPYCGWHLLILQPIGNIDERFHALCLKDSGVLYEDPYIQVYLLLA